MAAQQWRSPDRRRCTPPSDSGRRPSRRAAPTSCRTSSAPREASGRHAQRAAAGEAAARAQLTSTRVARVEPGPRRKPQSSADLNLDLKFITRARTSCAALRVLPRGAWRGVHPADASASDAKRTSSRPHEMPDDDMQTMLFQLDLNFDLELYSIPVLPGGRRSASSRERLAAAIFFLMVAPALLVLAGFLLFCWAWPNCPFESSPPATSHGGGMARNHLNHCVPRTCVPSFGRGRNDLWSLARMPCVRLGPRCG